MDAQQLRLLGIVALGGALGTLARYGASGWLTRGDFPWGTFFVNFTGTFLLAFLYYLSLERGLLSSDARSFLFIGVFGGYTTYSTYGLETTLLVRGGQVPSALLNIGLNGGVCLGGALVGAFIGLACGAA
jgi:fluoride exporter